MEILFFLVIVFLFMLAVFDLSVGVSNDAVNFLNSAIGSKAASFKRILIVASVGVFIGAAMSNGMMDIARHGIFRPEHFSFYEIICIFMAVMVTDIILLDTFNSLGMPTSTTVSMVFELLGAAFVVALIKMMNSAESLGLDNLLNTGKALSVIMGIFLSVAIAFVFGTVVQFLSRALFSFNYRRGLTWKIGLFGGLCMTAVIYFLLIKGVKDLVFMTPAVKEWISVHTLQLIGGSFVVFAVLMQVLHLLKVNVLKVIVLTGTFALAMAFAGNDLVNFIGVPLSGLSAYQDYLAHGSGNARGFMMDSLNGPSDTPVYFLVGAGLIMVVALASSKKSRNVSKTEIGLGSQNAGEEMFGTSRIARRLVRWTLSISSWIRIHMPSGLRSWMASRFNQDEKIIEAGAAFDLVRGSVNLVLAGALIAAGTSLKLPLSTTFVTFMVAMGTSLADRAWGRESAVFRITGVISVIGGWFLTAGAAFIGAGIVVAMMYWGGHWAMMALAALTVVIIIRSNRRFRAREEEKAEDVMFRTMLQTEDRDKVWGLLQIYMSQQQRAFLSCAAEQYDKVTGAFLREDLRTLDRAGHVLMRQKAVLKNARRKETLCLQRVSHEMAIEKNTWFHLVNNSCMSMLYNLLRIDEVCLEHVDNNFLPLPSCHLSDFEAVRTRISALFSDTLDTTEHSDFDRIAELRHRGEEIKGFISATYHRLIQQLREGDSKSMTVVYVYLNLLQESREMTSNLCKYLRGCAKLKDTDFAFAHAGA